MTIYRLNRVPDKLHVTLLELLGIQLDGPSAAATDLRFRLVEPPTEPLLIQGGRDRGRHARAPRATTRSSSRSREDFTIPPARPAAYVLQRGGQVKDVGVADGEAHPQGADQMPFGNPPAVGDALYVGFDEPIGRLLMQVDVDASPARGAGVNPEDPPLRWEVSQGDNGWEEAVVLEDLTGGFNYGAGAVELQLPPRSAVQPLGGHRMHWLRCRIDDKTRHGGAATTYTQAPEIYSLTAAPIGALLPALHAAQEENEILGVSDGTPARRSRCATARCSSPRPARRSRSRTPSRATGRPGSCGPTSSPRRSSTATTSSTRSPARSSSGRRSARPTAAGPSTARSRPRARSCASRATATAAGAPATSRPARSRRCARRSPASTPSPTRSRPTAASTPRRSSTPASARRWRSAPATARSRRRTSSSWPARRRPRVARAVCVPPQVTGGPVALHLVPRLYPADRQLTYDELQPDEALLQEVSEYLDERRLIGTTVQLLPCSYRGLSVIVNLQASPLADTARVEEDVAHALYTYINPLVGGNATGPGQGWDFGRALNQGELYGVVHAVDGVEFVKILRIYETNLQTGEQSSKPAGSHIVLEPDELIASAQHIVKATHREA